MASALVDELAGINCPVSRAEQITLVAEQFGNLPPVLAKLRRDALDEARAAKHSVSDLAIRLRISSGRIYQILRAGSAVPTETRTRPAATATDLAPSCSPPLVQPQKTTGGGDPDSVATHPAGQESS